MTPTELEKIINDANQKEKVSGSSDKNIINAINETIELTDKGVIRATREMIGL